MPHPDSFDEFSEDLSRSSRAEMFSKADLFHRQFVYELAKRPVSVNSRPPYPCTAEELRSYRKQPPPNVGQPLSPLDAVRHLEKFLDPNREPSEKVFAAQERFDRALDAEDWDPRLAIKAFKDLDIIFFAGKLMGKTNVCWLGRDEWSQEHPQDPIERVFRFTEYEGQGTGKVVLNAHTILRLSPNPFLQTWATLLHEMVVSSYRPVA
ncbi:MAG: hypothetical protein Q9167_002642 [Letrouitia subvulpina]